MAIMGWGPLRKDVPRFRKHADKGTLVSVDEGKLNPEGKLLHVELYMQLPAHE